MAKKRTIEVLVGTAILAALVIVLQCFVVIPLGAFTITLTLVPIMLGAILYGPKSGAFLGTVFGVTVSIQVYTGAAGVMSSQMLQVAPIITPLVCILKGLLAGLVAGLVYMLLKKAKHDKIGVVASAVSCPLVNTGIFVAALFMFYYDLLITYAADNQYADAMAFVFLGIVGLNFLVELVINVALIPVVLRIITIIRRGKL